MPQALRACVGLDQRDLLLAAARQAQVVHRFGVDREDAAGRAVFGRHVGDRGAIGQRQVLQAVAVELDELADHAQRTQHLGDGEHEVGRGRAFRQLAGQLEADDLRDQHRRGWPSIAASASMPPTPQPSTPMPLIMVVCESVPTTVSGNAIAAVRTFHDHARQVLQVHLVDDAGIRRHHLEVLERLLAPAQEPVALHVAFELDLAVEVQRVGTCRKRRPAPSGR